jgi:hypothetical protein
MDPWLDKYKLVLGDDWEAEIKKAVRTADCFVVCLKPGFDDTGFRQQEVRWALDALNLRPPGARLPDTVFLGAMFHPGVASAISCRRVSE